LVRDILTAAVFEFIEALEQELGAFGLLASQAQHIALTVCLDAQCQIQGLLADHAVSADIDP
jgi:hypothetical protein